MYDCVLYKTKSACFQSREFVQNVLAKELKEVSKTLNRTGGLEKYMQHLSEMYDHDKDGFISEEEFQNPDYSVPAVNHDEL